MQSPSLQTNAHAAALSFHCPSASQSWGVAPEHPLDPGAHIAQVPFTQIVPFSPQVVVFALVTRSGPQAMTSLPMQYA